MCCFQEKLHNFEKYLHFRWYKLENIHTKMQSEWVNANTKNAFDNYRAHIYLNSTMNCERKITDKIYRWWFVVWKETTRNASMHDICMYLRSSMYVIQYGFSLVRQECICKLNEPEKLSHLIASKQVIVGASVIFRLHTAESQKTFRWKLYSNIWCAVSSKMLIRQFVCAFQLFTSSNSNNNNNNYDIYIPQNKVN